VGRRGEGYLTRKGYQQGHAKIQKTDRQKFLTVEDVQRILDEVEKQQKAKWRRDHCSIFCGFYFGLRVGEAAILERESFRALEDQAFIRTLKQLPRVPVQCVCGRRWRASAKKIGNEVECPRCSNTVEVAGNPADYDTTPPEKSPPVVETKVVDYLREYLDKYMQPDQRWLFEGWKGEHISTRTLENIFSHYVLTAGLDPAYSYHALRHGRGVLLWERFQDQVLLRDMLRQKTLSAAEWYMHLSPARKRKILDKLDEE